MAMVVMQLKRYLFILCTGICVFSTEVHGKASLPSELRQCLTTNMLLKLTNV